MTWRTSASLGKRAVEIGDADRAPQTKVASDDARSPEGARQDPLGGPQPESALRGDALDDLVVGRAPEPVDVERAVGNGTGGGDQVLGFAIAELHGAQVDRRRLGEHRWRKAVDLVLADQVAPAVGAGESLPRRRRPAQIDLLGADGAHQSAQQASGDDRPHARVAFAQACDDRITLGEVSQSSVLQHEHLADGRLDQGGRAALFDTYLECGSLDRTNPAAGEGNVGVSVGDGPHQGRTVPAVEQVVAEVAQAGDRGRHVERPREADLEL